MPCFFSPYAQILTFVWATAFTAYDVTMQSRYLPQINANDREAFRKEINSVIPKDFLIICIKNVHLSSCALVVLSNKDMSAIGETVANVAVINPLVTHATISAV